MVDDVAETEVYRQPYWDNLHALAVHGEKLSLKDLDIGNEADGVYKLWCRAPSKFLLPP